jgi:hypothetical protein
MISKAQVEKLCRGISLDADMEEIRRDFRCCHCWFKRCLLADVTWLEDKNFKVPEKCPYLLEHVLMESSQC